MEFHPFDIELLKRRRQTNNLKECKKSYDIDNSTIPLISYRTNRMPNIEKFYVGDMYYIKKYNLFIIFSLNKVRENSQSIESCGFRILTTNSYNEKLSDGDFIIDDYLTIEEFFISYPSKSSDFEYVANVFLHENIHTFFEKYHRNSYNEKPLAYFIESQINNKNSDFNNHNFNFKIAYVENKKDWYHIFGYLNAYECFDIKQKGFNIIIKTDIQLYKTKSKNIQTQQDRQDKLLLTCKSGDLFKLKDTVKTSILIEEIIKYDEKTMELAKAYINFCKNFFVVFDGYNGTVKYVSTTIIKNNYIKDNKILLVNPLDTEMYEQINSNPDDLRYAEHLIEII